MRALSLVGILCAVGVIWLCPTSDADATADVTGDFAAQSLFGGGAITTVYHFDADGSALRRTMTCGSIGISGSVGSDSTTAGTWQLDGDTLRLSFGADSDEATLVTRDGAVMALHFGRRVFTRQ